MICKFNLKIISFFCLLLMFNACMSPIILNNKNLSAVSLETSGRSGHSIITISDSSISNLSTNQSGVLENIPINIKVNSKAAWKEINRIISNIDLNRFENFEAPTQERFYDGAAMTMISLDFEGQLMNSQSFDQANPPAELKELYDYLVSLENQ